MLKVAIALMIVLFFSHLVACLWHFVGDDEINSRNQTVPGWVHVEWGEDAFGVEFGEPFFGSIKHVGLAERYLVSPAFPFM